MRIEYDAPTDVAYIYLVDEITRAMVKRTRVVEREGINLDFSGSGTLIGVEVLQARGRVPALLLGRVLLSEQPATRTQLYGAYQIARNALIRCMRGEGVPLSDIAKVLSLDPMQIELIATQRPEPEKSPPEETP